MASVIGMTNPSPLYLLIEERLGGPLADYVASHKARMSWRAMAADLTAKAGVDVSYEALRGWFADRITVEVKVDSESAA